MFNQKDPWAPEQDERWGRTGWGAPVTPKTHGNWGTWSPEGLAGVRSDPDPAV